MCVLVLLVHGNNVCMLRACCIHDLCSDIYMSQKFLVSTYGEIFVIAITMSSCYEFPAAN